MEAVQSQYDNLAASFSDVLIFPAFGFAAVLALITPIAFLGSYSGQIKSPLKYSKFSGSDKEKSTCKVNGKILLIVAYFPAFVISIILYRYFHSQNPNLDTSTSQYRQFIAPSILLIVHFAKRLIESLFIHICSNKSEFGLAILIATNYSLVVGLTLYYQLLNGKVDDYKDCNMSFIIGIILYIIGQFGNFYHHYLLRINRLNNKTKARYVIPKGGLFTFVWMPHYFFEIISWIGMAVTSRHLTFYSTIMGMVGYLCGRSISTKNWYLQKFRDDCPDRKAIIPFIL